MPDSARIDAALMAWLNADATLLQLVPNLIYFDQAPAGSQRFVIVSLVEHRDELVFGGRSYEDALYAVEARILSKSVADANSKAQAAAARIDLLLDGMTLSVSGYVTMTVRRESRFRQSEVDDADSSIVWYRSGGNYRVVMSVGAT